MLLGTEVFIYVCHEYFGTLRIFQINNSECHLGNF